MKKIITSGTIIVYFFSCFIVFGEEIVNIMSHPVHKSVVTGGKGAKINLEPAILNATKIKLNWETQPWPDILQKTVRELNLDKSKISLMFLLSRQFSPKVMSRLTPLNNYITNDPIQNYDGIGAGMISYVTDKNNNIYAIPMRAFGPVLFYNKEILKENGFSKPPNSWEEYIRIAKNVSGRRKDGAKVYGMRFSADNVISSARAFGGDMLTKDFKILFTNKPMIRAIKEAQELYNSGTIPKNFMNMSADDWLTLEQNGQVAFAERGPTYYKNLQDKKTSKVVGKIGITNVPASETVDFEIVPGNAAFWCMTIPKNSPEPSKAWEIIKLLSSDYGATTMALNGNAPTKLSVYEDTMFKEANKDWITPASKSLVVARPYWPAFDEQPRVHDIFKEYVVMAITVQMTAEEAMKTAKSKIQNLLP